MVSLRSKAVHVVFRSVGRARLLASRSAPVAWRRTRRRGRPLSLRPAVSLGKGGAAVRLSVLWLAPLRARVACGAFRLGLRASAKRAGLPGRPPSGLFRPLPSPPSSRAKGHPRRLYPSHGDLVGARLRATGCRENHHRCRSTGRAQGALLEGARVVRWISNRSAPKPMRPHERRMPM